VEFSILGRQAVFSGLAVIIIIFKGSVDFSILGTNTVFGNWGQ